ncbi:MAG: hypothetical protein ABSF45_09970 [Terriglobia bacterium]|jgi:hypothetical protein
MAQIHSDPSPKAHDVVASSVAFTRADLGPVVLLVVSLVGMFWKVVFTSAMFFYRDVYNYTFPSARFIHDLCRQGFLPYWNPYLNYGQPVLANPNLLFFYPFTLLIVLLPIDIAFTMHFLVHFAWAGIGVYVLARSWGQTYGGAFFAALVFMFSGPVLSLGDLYNESACAAWIPWALLVTDRALESPRLRPWIMLIVIFSFQWLAGEPLTLLATFGLCFAYAFYRRGDWWKLWSKPNFRLLAIFFLVGTGMMLLCAAQFLPASDLLSQSRRGLQGLRFRETANWAVNPFSLPEMIVPDFFGSGIAAPTGWLWLMSDSNLPYFLSVFLGFVPIFCALAGWALGRDRQRNFVAGAAGAFLLLSFGHFTPVFALAYLLFPPLTVVRYPVKLFVLVTFLLAILAGWGFDALRSPASPWKAQGRRLLTPLKVFLTCIVAILWVAWLAPVLIMSPTQWVLSTLGETPFNLHQMPGFLVTVLRYQLPGLAGFCLGGVVLAYGLEQGKSWARPGLYAFALLAIGQLVAVNSAANPTVPKTFFTYRPRVLDEFKDPPGTYRVASFWPIVQTPDTKNLQTYINFGSIPEAANFGPMAQGAFQARLQLATGSMLNRVEGSINLDLERSLPPYLYDIEIYQDRHVTDPLHVDCLLGRTNVKYIIRPTPADSAATRALGDLFNGSPLPSRLYEDLCFVPRAYVAGNSLLSTDSTETLDHLASPDFDALNTVILAAPAGSSPAVSDSAPAGQVEIVHRDPNSVTLRAQLAHPSYIVLLDRYDPNWQATLDSRPAPMLRANQIFRAVYAGTGLHEIRFDYRQRGFRLGVIISLLTLGTLALLYFKR